MTAITPKGSSGVTNLPSSSQGMISSNTVPEDGMAWGAEVAQDTQGDSTFNFDAYASSTASQMQGLGYTSTATAQYINAMYAGYLGSGGEATGQATGNVGASSNAEAGIYGQGASGVLGLPGAGQEPPVGGTGMSLSPSTAATIGQNLAQNSNVNYGQWRANMEADLQDAGYAPGQVTQFMGQIDNAYYGAKPNDYVNQGMTQGHNLTGISNSAGLETYITNQVVPTLQQDGLSTDQINQYVEGLRAGAFGQANPGMASSGLQQGQEVASVEASNSSFNFDSYASSIASQLASSSAGLSPDQRAAYITAMYAGYLRGGGDATVAASSQVLSQSPSEAAAGSGGNISVGGSTAVAGTTATGGATTTSAATTTTGGGSVPPGVSGGTGATTTTTGGGNPPPGISGGTGATTTTTGGGNAPPGISGASGSGGSTFAGAGGTYAAQGVQLGSQLTSISNSTDLENYINNTVVPTLQKQGLNPDQVNQYISGVRASAYGGSGAQATISSGLQQGASVAAAESGNSGFNFDSYAVSIASVIAQSSYGLTPGQQAAYITAMYAGYLGAGGGSTVEASTVYEVSTGTTGGGSGVGGSSGVGGTSNTASAISVGATPGWASQIYTEISSAPSTAALSSDAVAVITATAALSSAAALEAAQPTSTHAANLQLQWQNARGAEAQFWSDLAATNDPSAPSAAVIAQQFRSNPYFTLEGTMPSSYTPGSMPTATSSAAFVSLEALAASSALGPGVSLPSNLGTIIDNPSALSSMSQSDFSGMAEGLIALYQQNPAQYFAAVQSIHDPNLASALNYAVQDMVSNGADSLVQNGASITQENNTLGGFFSTAQASPSTYAAWLPQSTDPSVSVGAGLAAMPASTSDFANIQSFLQSSNFDGSSPGKYAEACQMMAGLWKTNQAAYYQVLSGITDPQLRNAINSGVQAEYTKDPENIGNARGTTDFSNMWLQVFGKTGPGASSPTYSGFQLSVSSQTGGMPG